MGRLEDLQLRSTVVQPVHHTLRKLEHAIDREPERRLVERRQGHAIGACARSLHIVDLGPTRQKYATQKQQTLQKRRRESLHGCHELRGYARPE